MQGAADMGHHIVNMQGFAVSMQPRKGAKIWRSYEPNHTVGVIGGAERQDDPEIMIRCPTIDIFFARRDSMESIGEVNEEGVVVIQTSNDLEVVAAFKLHATEGSDTQTRACRLFTKPRYATEETGRREVWAQQIDSGICGRCD